MIVAIELQTGKGFIGLFCENGRFPKVWMKSALRVCTRNELRWEVLTHTVVVMNKEKGVYSVEERERNSVCLRKLRSAEAREWMR